MTQTRTRISRSGMAPNNRRRHWYTALLSAFVLLLSACSTDPQVNSARADGATIAAYEAEHAVLASSYLAVRSEPGTSGGQVLVHPNGIQSAAAITEDAYLTFEVTNPGEHFLWARVMGRSFSEDAIYVGFNGRLERIYPEDHGVYVWLPVTFEYLEAGENVISLGHAEPEMSIDALVVTNRADLRGADLESWLLSDTLPPMPDPESNDEPGDEVPTPQPTPDEAPEPEAEPEPAPKPAPKPAPEPQPAPDRAKNDTSLRGDPNFRTSNLPTEAQIWHRRLWEAIENPVSAYDADEWAKSDDLYTYARKLHTHIQTLLTAFRVTGDLKLLDEVDRLTQLMRRELADSWRSTKDGSSQRDGYLNWVWRYNSKEYYGKDTNKLDEIKTHALIASVAYALDLNRGYKSPGGRDYGDHADFWLDYLVNHFEAKWREREKEPTGFPFMMRPHTHTYYSWTKWHYYMGKLTGNSGYSRQANDMAEMLWDHEIIPTSSPSGTAYVWNRSVISEGGGADYLHPVTYARYVFSDAAEFNLEGFDKWASDDNLTRFARTVAEFVIDPKGAKNDSDWFSSDIGGGKSRAGIRSDSSWSRNTVYRWESSPYAMVMAWDPTGEIEDISMKVIKKLGGVDKPRTVDLPASFLVDRMLNR